jgi:hypothetical protein
MTFGPLINAPAEAGKAIESGPLIEPEALGDGPLVALVLDPARTSRSSSHSHSFKGLSRFGLWHALFRCAAIVAVPVRGLAGAIE